MNDTAVALPPFKAIAAALRKTTEHLAHELATPTESPPDWSAFEWAVARSVAGMQGISFLLATTLRWRGPAAWESFLQHQREQSLLRDVLIERLLERLDVATRDAQIACVAMKGAALRALHVYAPGERPMGDIDLLVREADLTAIAAMMDGLGYRGTTVPDREIVYELPRKAPLRSGGEHVDNPLKVEVHTSVAEPLPVRKVDITARLQPINPRPGLNGYPSLAALLLHCLLRAASNMRAHALRQIQLHDIALLTRRLGEADWEALLEESRSAEERWWLYPPLALTARYYACEAPAGLLRKLRANCPPVLRKLSDRDKLTDVSWSNLRISAFPGIAWSRNATDILRYMRSRTLPDRKALAGIDVALEQQPHLNQLPWYQVSQGQRILRWLLSRPPRVQTILSVAAALKDRRTN
jgi:Uncharacterised nucleotidyltransferase